MKKITKLLLVVTTLASVLSGCGSKGTTVSKIESDMPKGEIAYPIQTEETLTYWSGLNRNASIHVQSYAESEFAKEYMKKTGIKVEYQHPAIGEEAQGLNLLIASGELPDIIETGWLSMNPTMQIEDKVIIPLNELFEDYSPNLMKYLKENPEIDRQIKTDDGQYYAYPFIRGHEKLLSTAGFMLRRDWLNELSLEMPETMEDWEKVLTAFKTKGEQPLGLSMGDLVRFSGGYGIGMDMYINDEGKIEYSRIKKEFKEFLTDMKRWYDNGIIDPNAAMLDTGMIRTNILNNKTGVTFGAGGSGMGVILKVAKDTGVEIDLVAAPFPSTEKGLKPEFGNKQPAYTPINCAAISAQSKNPALAARYLDYSYSEAGTMLNNFGVEGVSYKMVDGYPQYTDLVANNPEGLAMGEVMPLYMRSSYEGPFVQDVRYIEQYYAEDAQKDALSVWSNCNDEKHRIPQITLTDEESREYAKLMNAISSYASEAMVNFIVGEVPLEEYDEYVAQIEKLGIARAVEIQQTALDRFNNRK